MAMNVVSYVRSVTVRSHRNLTKLDLAIVGAALIGAAVGFLWFNAFPAEVIMGDTGSMAFGGALAAFAIMMKVEVLLLFIGGIFVIEALSVMIQVFSFKRFGRRVFLMAPIHHHFEMKAWSETKIMVRFWIVAGLLCAVGFALFYRYYFANSSSPGMSGGDIELALLDAARLEPEEDVLVLGGGRLRSERTSGSATVGSTSSGRRSTSSRSCSARRTPWARAGSRISWASRRCCPCRTRRWPRPRADRDGRRRVVGAAEELARVLSAGGRASFAEPDEAAAKRSRTRPRGRRFEEVALERRARRPS